MDYNQLVEVGTIQRTHGVNGELQILWTESFDIDTPWESVFLQIEGIPVPFFISSIRPKGNDAIIKFDEVDTPDKATQLLGCKVLVDKNLLVLDEIPTDPNDLSLLIGFTLLSEVGNAIGTIADVENYAGNWVFMVECPNGKELLIPAAGELVKSIFPEKKTIVINLPEGLLDLFE